MVPPFRLVSGDDQSMRDSDPRHDRMTDQHSTQSDEPSRVVSATCLGHYLQRKISTHAKPSVPMQRSSKPSRTPSDQDQP